MPAEGDDGEAALGDTIEFDALSFPGLRPADVHGRSRRPAARARDRRRPRRGDRRRARGRARRQQRADRRRRDARRGSTTATSSSPRSRRARTPPTRRSCWPRGCVARNAVARGLTSKPWVKTSLAPGSKVVTKYLDHAGLTDDLEALGFHLVGYGCTTCIGNSGPLPRSVSEAVARERPRRRLGAVGQPQLRGAHQPRREDELPGVAAAGGRLRAGGLDGRRHRQRPDRRGPRRRRRLPARPVAVGPGGRRDRRARGALGDVPLLLRRRLRGRRALELPGGADRRPLRVGRARRPTCTCRRTSRGCRPSRRPVSDIEGARVLALLGDSVTTDHISPAGSIKPDSPAGLYLQEHGVSPRDFNSYGARRGNHEVMVRGTFANIRLRNQLAPGTEGGVTMKFSGAPLADADADLRGGAGVHRGGHAAGGARRQGVRLGLVARLGGEGHAAAGRARRAGAVLRAHPPLEPHRHGRAAAAAAGAPRRSSG